MWACDGCGRRFANRNQTHTCAPRGDVDRHFTGQDPLVRACFDRVLEVTQALGPVIVLPERTRIALQVRMSFAAFTARNRWLDGHVVLARERPSPRFRRIEVFGPRNVLHVFRLRDPAEVDAEVASWLAEAYRVGGQEHLRAGGGTGSPPCPD